MLSSSHLKADADKCPRGSGLLPGPLLPVDTFLWEVPSQAHTPSRVPMFSSGLSQMSPGWLGLRDILRLSRGRWGRGPAPRWVTAGPTGHGTLYSPPVLPPLLAQGSLGSAGQFWVCVCVCAHTHVWGGEAGTEGRTGAPRSVWSGVKTSSGAAAHGSGLLTAGHQVSRSGGRETGPGNPV